MNVSIRCGFPEGPEIVALLRAHLDHMARLSPPESIHALDLDALQAPEIVFWTAWCGEKLAGCGALKELDTLHGEIKSMHTATRFRGRGIARQLLRVIIDEAWRRGYRRLSLETGSTDHFVPARNLYAQFGFSSCGPFSSYEKDPHSAFMTCQLPGRS